MRLKRSVCHGNSVVRRNDCYHRLPVFGTLKLCVAHVTGSSDKLEGMPEGDAMVCTSDAEPNEHQGLEAATYLRGELPMMKKKRRHGLTSPVAAVPNKRERKAPSKLRYNHASDGENEDLGEG